MNGTPSTNLQFSQLQRLSPQEQAEMARLAKRIRQDFLAMERLADQVYQLMQADLKQRHERNHSYGGRT